MAILDLHSPALTAAIPICSMCCICSFPRKFHQLFETEGEAVSSGYWVLQKDSSRSYHFGLPVSTYTLPAEDVVVVDEDAASRIQRLTKVLNADTTGLQMLTKMKWENMQTLKLVYVACRHPADCRTLFM
ncbi:hypothetical protein LINPERPRIM_LOCUS21114 [Linum perenne]